MNTPSPALGSNTLADGLRTAQDARNCATSVGV